ncbi:hypothetical protein SERLA73DRAFT_149169 [Serpula lacrymans var. lacrymans S7.3]|uniref:Uncharacterized protein n=1 Tax=Serpula lacrymans var. lacrymans (strain S7.3) TaxID=936435 RepID=F8PFZ0_SERL3|nr:hypothetical protein SERLA73DRAFT_149169 [Serpula lacrymans var. lacrymans S7.3]
MDKKLQELQDSIIDPLKLTLTKLVMGKQQEDSLRSLLDLLRHLCISVFYPQTEVMSPTSSNMSSSQESLRINVPKLDDKGMNWSSYKLRLKSIIEAKRLVIFLKGKAKPPKPFRLNSNEQPIEKDGSLADEDDVEDLEEKIDFFQ